MENSWTEEKLRDELRFSFETEEVRNEEPLIDEYPVLVIPSLLRPVVSRNICAVLFLSLSLFFSSFL